MSERLYEVGQRVDKWCVVCGEERGHVVASVSVKGRITRVSCPGCGARGSYKNGNGASAKRAVSAPQPVPYDGAHSYHVSQFINHPSYGPGEVIALIEPKKMDVLFADRVRRLVHARSH